MQNSDHLCKCWPSAQGKLLQVPQLELCISCNFLTPFYANFFDIGDSEIKIKSVLEKIMKNSKPATPESEGTNSKKYFQKFLNFLMKIKKIVITNTTVYWQKPVLRLLKLESI